MAQLMRPTDKSIQILDCCKILYTLSLIPRLSSTYISSSLPIQKCFNSYCLQPMVHNVMSLDARYYGLFGLVSLPHAHKKGLTNIQTESSCQDHQECPPDTTSFPDLPPLLSLLSPDLVSVSVVLSTLIGHSLDYCGLPRIRSNVCLSTSPYL